MFTSATHAQSPKLLSKPSPTPLSPPVIEFQAVPAAEVVERGQQTPVYLLISNKSEKSVRVSQVVLLSNSFTANPLVINTDLQGFRSLEKELVITAENHSAFNASKSILSLEYSWNLDTTPVPSIQTATLSMEVRRRFDEEAKGLPGGSGAFLYLLLPILPALLTYQLINRRRLNEGWNMPTLGADQLVPAFFLAVVFSVIALVIARRYGEINYSRPSVFVLVLFLSAVAGGLIPASRWMIESIRWRVSGFNETDDGPTYLKKALRQRQAGRKFIWTTGNVGDVEWKGIRLKQPNGNVVLGATLQVAATDKLTAEQWNEAKAKMFTRDKGLDIGYLHEMLKTEMIDVAKMGRVTAGGKPQDAFVVVDAVKGFQDSRQGTETDLVRAS
jgi:hypothetical protein